MSYGSDYLREAMTLNERKVNNKKSLKESIEDKQPLKEETSNPKEEIYNIVTDAIFNILDTELQVNNVALKVSSYNPEWCNEEYDPRIDDAVKQLATILTENYFKNM